MTRSEDSQILRKYYKEKDFITSVEGILKVVSVVSCIVVSVTSVAALGACAGAGALAGGSAGGALAAAGALALLAAAALCRLPARVPLLWIYTDVVSSSAIGVSLVVSAVLGAVFCQLRAPLDFVHFILTLATAAMVTGGAALEYARAMRRLDAARPREEPRPPPPADVDV